MPLMAAILKFGLVTTSDRSFQQIVSKGVISIRRFARMSQLDEIPDVDIERFGKFKYILINLQDNVNKTSKKIVRGYVRAQWHIEILHEVNDEIKKYDGLEVSVLGGGRIEHYPRTQILEVYGYSQGFGKADHQVTAEILRKTYPDYKVTWSDQGY